MKVVLNYVLKVAIAGVVVTGVLLFAGLPVQRLAFVCWGIVGTTVFLTSLGDVLRPRWWDKHSQSVGFPLAKLMSLGGGLWFGAFGAMFFSIAVQGEPELTMLGGWAFFGTLAVSVVLFLSGLFMMERLEKVSKVIVVALREYADRHDGWFPKGEASPEASFTLLQREKPDQVTVDVLRGMTVSTSAVRARLESGNLLTSNTCGWHYVEGLRKDDDPRIALFWDRTEPGHLYSLLLRGGHLVFLVGDIIEYIPGDRWEEFQAEQQRLRAAVKREQTTASTV